MYVEKTKNWIERVVIGYNLCPFAKPVFAKNQIHYVLSEAKTPAALMQPVLEMFDFLTSMAGDDTETAILIHPFALQDFEEYLDFLDFVEDLLVQAGLEGVLQIASFHPQYQFEDTEADAPENYTNRSPYPMLHFLRADTLETAIQNYPDVADIPAKNIEKMRRLSREELEKGQFGE